MRKRSVKRGSPPSRQESRSSIGVPCAPQRRAAPGRVRFRCDHCPTVKDVLRDRGWAQVGEEDDSWHLFWCEVHQLRATLDHKRLDANQRVPHFRNHYELTKKNLLTRNLKRLRQELAAVRDRGNPQ